MITNSAQLVPNGQPGPDADLLALCDEMTTIDLEAERIGEDCSPAACAAADLHSEQTGPRWVEIRTLIADLPARTMEGVRAKARIARSWLDQDGSPQHDPEAKFLWSALSDVLRVGPM